MLVCGASMKKNLRFDLNSTPMPSKHPMELIAPMCLRENHGGGSGGTHDTASISAVETLFQSQACKLIWMVVKIMVPFWVLILVRHLIFRVPKKGP